MVKKKQNKKNQKKLWVAVIIVLLSGLVTAIILGVYNHSNKKSLQDTYMEADAIVLKEGYDKGQQVLDSSFGIIAGDKERSEVYIQKSTLAINNSKLEEAIEFALTAEKIYPTRVSAMVVAQTYEEMGNRSLALKYYELVIKRTSAQEKQLAPDEYNYFKSTIEKLSS